MVVFLIKPLGEGEEERRLNIGDSYLIKNSDGVTLFNKGGYKEVLGKKITEKMLKTIKKHCETYNTGHVNKFDIDANIGNFSCERYEEFRKTAEIIGRDHGPVHDWFFQPLLGNMFYKRKKWEGFHCKWSIKEGKMEVDTEDLNVPRGYLKAKLNKQYVPFKFTEDLEKFGENWIEEFIKNYREYYK